ncbi:MAG: helix-turn-helix domain-containing protein [Lachnospiraceae bacterium]|nr:helix-turn-helix domain-containing protein [Lachnospiraceae bacterium]
MSSLRIAENIMKLRKQMGITQEELANFLGVKASADLMCGRPQAVIDGIEDLLNPSRAMNQSEGILLQAYLMNGEVEKADTFTQASMYLHLLLLVADSTSFLMQHMQQREVCEETIQRTDVLIETYHMEKLNPNVVAGYDYQVAAYKRSSYWKLFKTGRITC